MESFDPTNPHRSTPHGENAADASPDRSVAAPVAAEVGAEAETATGWLYETCELLWPGGERTVHRVTLSYADHDHLCGGSQPPSRVAEAVLVAVAGVLGRERTPEKLDASTARRVVPDLADHISPRL